MPEAEQALSDRGLVRLCGPAPFAVTRRASSSYQVGIQ